MAKAKKKAPIKIARKSRAARIAEESKVGAEVVDWTNVVDVDHAIYTCLRHYNYFYDTKDARSWVITWLKAYSDKNTLELYRKAETWRTNTTLGGLCRMSTHGAPIGEKNLAYINRKIGEIIDSVQSKDDDKIVALERKSPAEIVKERTSDMIAQFEEIIDDYNTCDGAFTKKVHDTIMDTFSAYDELKKVDAPYNMAKAVHDYYVPLLDELTELVNKKSKDLDEGYSHLKPLERKRYKAFIEKLVGDAELFMNGKKAMRKAPTRKPKAAASQVDKLKYEIENTEFKITSINPVNIVGASMVVLFNTKYKCIIILYSDSKNGFTVKGTTIQNIDVDNSIKKTVRKPEELLPEILKTTKAKLVKTVKDLKTKGQEPNGRVNDNTVILRAFK